ncbi:MAG TPA: pyridoxamine 5'-phosphate oxidase family protein [Actinomycetota bacterium]|nr:pyridoxamine 5'-phosphate oxidase family protein [Actinomycetota bacterium]
MSREPETTFARRFSSEDASAKTWAEAEDRLKKAELYWLSTVRGDGRPHVTPLIAVWLDESMFFCTGSDERKNKNLLENPHCVLTTGCDTLNEGFDIVLEGDAVRVTDRTKLQLLADAYLAKYGKTWVFEVEDAVFRHEGSKALVYEIAPITAFGFGKGEFSQTRWRFDH